MTRKIYITGFLKTLSPLHIAAPSSVRVDPATGEFTYNKEDGIPCATVQKIGIPARTKKTDEKEAKDFFAKVPVIAANNLSGRIRRRVGAEFLRALKDTGGQTVSISTYSAIMCGAATGSPDGVPITYDEYIKAKAHPFLGLMGGGPRMMERRAQVHNSFAFCRTTEGLLNESRVPFAEIYQGAWPAAIDANFLDVTSDQITQITTSRRNDDLRDLKDMALASASITDFTTAYNERQSRIIDEATDKAKGNTKLFTFQATEFVCPFVSFPVVFVLNDVTDAQAGLWFRGFEAFCNDEALGGCVRNGWGEFRIQNAKVAVFEDDQLTGSEDLGDEDGFRIKAISAWLDVAEKQESAEIDWLMRLPAEKTKKKGESKDVTA